jgi:hypothetical protein
MPDTNFSNSYILTDAIFEAYLSGDPRAEAIALNAASASVQGWYLKRATKAIDTLPLKGCTYYYLTSGTPGEGQQNRQFPRWIDGQCFGWVNDTSLPEVPQDVLDACCEEALGIYLVQNTPDKLQRLQLQREGASAVSYGGTSETYVAGNRHKGLMSKEAYDLLKGYILGALEASFG